MSTSRLVKLSLFVTAMAMMGARAADGDAKSKAQFNKVDAWAEGVVSEVNSEKGTFTLNAQKLPFASAHAAMRKEFETKSAGASTEKRTQLAEEINREWRSKLMAAQAEKPAAAADIQLSAPKDGDLVTLEKKSVQDVTFAYQPDEAGQKTEPDMMGELVSIDIYDIPSRNASTPTAATSLRQLKAGDLVKIGYDSETKEAYLMIVLHSAPASTAR